MQFRPNETQQMLRDGARRLFATEHDSASARRIEASADGFAADLWARIAELGWSAVQLPESVGGGGLGTLELCVLAEEMGRAAVSAPLLASSGLAATCLAAVPPHPFATELLKLLATTRQIVTAALIDDSGRDERSVPTLQMTEGEEGAVLNGSKQLVPYAASAEAMLVSASTSDGELVLMVPDTSGSGLTMRRHQVMGTDPLFEVRFDEVIVPASRVVARGEDAAAALDAGLEVASLLAMAEMVGCCEGILQLAAEHATTREQFGQAIGQFQGVSHPLADMRIQTDAIRLLMLEAAWLLDQGRPAAYEIASAKVLANEAVEKITVDGHRLHGAIGYSKEHDAHLYTRRARALCVAWGDTERQLERAAVAMGL